MLAAMEDLLDTWPGTLIVVSHDRYFVERVTDQQYAILDGHLRHVPGGVDEYLRLAAAGEADRNAVRARAAASASSASRSVPARAAGSPGAQHARGAGALSAPELRQLKKQLAVTERRLEKATAARDALHQQLAAHDQSDYERLQLLSAELAEVDAEIASLEDAWLTASERIG